MPKSPMTDPITDQEIAFARLILSGTMTDRRAAEAVGLNPTTAAYTKSKPRVRDYITEHRAAVTEKRADQEEVGPRHLAPTRDQILDRLWQLASLTPEQTRSSIAGQIKAMAMIVAIEGLIPDRRRSPAPAPPAAPPAKPQIYIGEPYRRPQHQAEDTTPDAAATVDDVQPAAPQASEPKPAETDNQSPAAIPEPIYPQAQHWIPDATGATGHANLYPAGPHKLPVRPGHLFRGRAR